MLLPHRYIHGSARHTIRAAQTILHVAYLSCLNTPNLTTTHTNPIQLPAEMLRIPPTHTNPPTSINLIETTVQRATSTRKAALS